MKKTHSASMGWFMKKYQRIVEEKDEDEEDEEKEKARADEQASSSFDLS